MSSSSDHKIRLNPTTSPDTQFHNLAIQSPNNFSCRHLSEFRLHFSPNSPYQNLPNRPRPIACGACAQSPQRLYACLSCAVVVCRAHAPPHSIETSHHVAVDIDRAELFCCACADQIYDGEFDAAVVGVGAAQPENLRKKRRVDYKPWIPDLEERALIAENSSPLPTSTLTIGGEEIPGGLRGLCNLGNTCFMNSVLQALLHTPPMRNYFLSDKHNRFYCERENRTIVTRQSESSNRSNTNTNINNKNVQLCLACDLDAIFSAVFSGDWMPYSPAKFLYSWWKHASNLASYEQQDAHEFFISMLDGIHEKMQKDRRKTHRQGSGDCCIAHRIFSGILRSDVMCTSCGFTSTTYDPCVDISLDLEPNQVNSGKTSSKSNHSVKNEADPSNTGQNPSISTLTGCLDRFTRPERLGSDQKFFCQQCQVKQESVKQMSIRKLPLVSCFHIKRFEHSPIRKMSRKIDRYLQFPFSLDMAPYMSSSILRSRYGNRIFPFDGDEQDSSSGFSSEFELFAVITHSGKLDAGHYVTYLRLSNQWYKCDDAWITRVHDNIVRSAQGYMMFYVQKMLYYRASEKVSAA